MCAVLTDLQTTGKNNPELINSWEKKVQAEKQENMTEIDALKSEVDRAWKLVEVAKEKEEKARNII